MEAVARDINPEAHVIHLMHGLPDYDITSAARTLETLHDVPVGFHVCVVDPGVGTTRRALIIKVGRGDHLIGPDNGVLIPATRFLGGCVKAITITNAKYMRQPVSPVFHGRDVFMPAAAHLSLGVPMEKFGNEVAFSTLVKAPYEEAVLKGNALHAQVIRINKYGSLHLNILNVQWDSLGIPKGQVVTLQFPEQRVPVPFVETFGDVGKAQPLMLKDDYGRVEVAISQGNFAQQYGIHVGDSCTLQT